MVMFKVSKLVLKTGLIILFFFRVDSSMSVLCNLLAKFFMADLFLRNLRRPFDLEIKNKLCTHDYDITCNDSLGCNNIFAFKDF